MTLLIALMLSHMMELPFQYDFGIIGIWILHVGFHSRGVN